MTRHVSWETLNGFVDGALDASEREVVLEHMNACGECHARLTRLQTLLSAAGAAGGIEPPAGAWDAVRQVIESRKEVPLHAGDATTAKNWTRRRTNMSVVAAAAAAVALIVSSSAVTTFILQRQQPAQVADGGPSIPPEAPVPADFVEVERGYVLTVSELNSALDASRAKLAPGTVRTVDRSLAIIDAAINEARTALLADPASGLLRGVLARNYQQKIDLLRRAAERAVSN